MSRFLNQKYESLEAYVPGEQPKDMQYIKLNTNESPFPPPQDVIDAVSVQELENLRLYCDPDCSVLKEALANAYGVQKNNVFVANGSDDILNFAFMAFGGNGAVFADITYGFYKVYCALHGIEYREIPLLEDFSIRPDDYFNAGCMIAIANPNAPTGIALSVEEIELILQSNHDHVVLVDEAYVDFGGESVINLIKQYKNLLVVRTYSKSRSMAGARLGFAFADEELIADLERIKFSTNPYSVNRMTLAAGAAALSEDSSRYFAEKCSEIIAVREYLSQQLKNLGFDVLPSKTNFLFAKHYAIEGEKIYTLLKEKGILVRHFTAERIKSYNRITIGTKEQTETLLLALKEIIKEQ